MSSFTVCTLKNAHVDETKVDVSVAFLTFLVLLPKDKYHANWRADAYTVHCKHVRSDATYLSHMMANFPHLLAIFLKCAKMHHRTQKCGSQNARKGCKD